MRLELTRKTDLALRAVTVLGASREWLKAPRLAQQVGTTSAFIGQVVAPLIGAGWVTSEPGPRGGYRACAGENVSLLQLIEAVEGPVADGRCVLRDGPCPGAGTCALHDAWLGARQALLDELGRTPVLYAQKES